MTDKNCYVGSLSQNQIRDVYQNRRRLQRVSHKRPGLPVVVVGPIYRTRLSICVGYYNLDLEVKTHMSLESLKIHLLQFLGDLIY